MAKKKKLENKLSVFTNAILSIFGENPFRPMNYKQICKLLGIKGVEPRLIPGGAAQLLCLPLDPKKKVLSLTLRTLSNDVVIGLMAVTLQR